MHHFFTTSGNFLGILPAAAARSAKHQSALLRLSSYQYEDEGQDKNPILAWVFVADQLRPPRRVLRSFPKDLHHHFTPQPRIDFLAHWIKCERESGRRRRKLLASAKQPITLIRSRS